MILVTGASGFLGGHLLHALSQQSSPVRALYHHQSPAERNFSAYSSVEWQKCDLLDVYALEKVMAGVKHVYHCAAIVSFDRQRHQQMIRENVAITANLVDASLEAGIDKMVHVSSVAALGRPGRQATAAKAVIHEDIPWEKGSAHSAYAESKYLAELEVWRGIAEGLPAVIVNPSTILGVGDWHRSSARLMTVVDREFPWFTQGVNGWVDVRDVAAAMILLMKDSIAGERFIISAGNFSFYEVFTQMARALERRPPYRKADKWMTELVWRLEWLKSRLAGKETLISKESARIAQAKSYYDNSKFLDHFPAFSYRTLTETIKEMAAAYRQSYPQRDGNLNMR